MINGKFIDVIAPVTDALFFKDFLNKIDHIPGVVRPVIAAVNEKDIEFFPVKSEFLFVLEFFKFTVSTGALGALFRRAVTSVGIPADVAFPAITW
jgi:hypothetical protein